MKTKTYTSDKFALAFHISMPLSPDDVCALEAARRAGAEREAKMEAFCREIFGLPANAPVNGSDSQAPADQDDRTPRI